MTSAGGSTREQVQSGDRGLAPRILAVNAGSSSVKFAVYRLEGSPQRLLRGNLDRIGLPGTKLTFADAVRKDEGVRECGSLDHAAAASLLLDWLDERAGLTALAAVGHRVANGGARFREAQRVTGELLDELRRISAYSPEHLPAEIALIERFGERVPQLPQVACFDTTFHRDLPRVARMLALPRRFQEKGVERLGFHGLSYAYLMEELARLAGPERARGRVILAHLGNGASLAAVRGGRCVDTSMGFTPAAGLPMSTRAGDLDPGLVLFLAQTEGTTAEQFHRMVNRESGLLGVSETTSDVRDLLAREAGDARAADALALFCYQAKKWIGAFAAALGGVDTLVFSGGIGENAPAIRARICDGLEFLGVALDAARNGAGEAVVSSDASRVDVRVIRTDEEVMIARAAAEVLDAAASRSNMPSRSRP